ncbi:hypothetical protein HPB49_024560 [Dermacentor silvarum]|uniref:Uncharacterized protein n=1 Tax=Dermacentor silvarum TaxID=543639 RepID=A0ACB8CC95_DERSI|nr:hypothetical protein HPB49_024560 [Dermacentor silvarum]
MELMRHRLFDLEAGLFPSDDAFEDLEDRYCSSRSSGDEDDGFGGAAMYREQHDDRPCVQALIFFTVITCLAIVLAVIFVDAADVTKPSLNTSYNHGGSSSVRHWRERTFEPGNSPERFLVCTIGGNESPEFRAYPPDGVCNWIIYTHVGYEENAPNGTRLAPRDPGSWASWEHFLGHRAQYSATRLLPSHAWRDDLALTTRQARSLNRTLRSMRMAGLAFLNVRISVDRVPALAETLEALAWANPGMFLALGASFEQLADATAPRLVPAWLLDQLVTPLSLFVLETHLPPPGGACTAGFSTARQPSYYAGGSERDRVGRLTFVGARAFLAQPALRYADPKVLARCVSILAGAIVFHVLANEKPVPGAPCSHWSLAKVASVCRLPSVRDDVEAVAMYGSRADGAFFSYESAVHMWAKVFTVLQSMLFSRMPTCLAVYALDLDASPGLCDMHQERPARLVYRAHEVLTALKADSSDNSSDDSLE